MVVVKDKKTRQWGSPNEKDETNEPIYFTDDPVTYADAADDDDYEPDFDYEDDFHALELGDSMYQDEEDRAQDDDINETFSGNRVGKVKRAAKSVAAKHQKQFAKFGAKKKESAIAGSAPAFQLQKYIDGVCSVYDTHQSMDKFIGNCYASGPFLFSAGHVLQPEFNDNKEHNIIIVDGDNEVYELKKFKLVVFENDFIVYDTTNFNIKKGLSRRVNPTEGMYLCIVANLYENGKRTHSVAFGKASIVDADNNCIEHTVSTTKGVSGSPIFGYRPESRNWVFVGVHQGAYEGLNTNFGHKLTSSVRPFLVSA